MRLLGLYISYLKTAVAGMCVATVVFFIYGGIRATGPLASIAWYAVGLVVAAAIVTLLVYIARYELSNAALQTASLVLAKRVQKKEEPQSVSFVVVCFNEEPAVPLLVLELSTLVRGFAELESEILVIDDASVDNTGKILLRQLELVQAPRMSVRLVRNEIHLGAKQSQDIGFSKATGDLVLAVNVDAMVRAHRPEPFFARRRKPDSWRLWPMWVLMRPLMWLLGPPVRTRGLADVGQGRRT